MRWGASKKEVGEKIETVEADSPNGAFKKAVEKWKYPEFALICIDSGLGYNAVFGYSSTWFNNPHYVELKQEGKEKGKKVRSLQPARPDGAIGWFEKIEDANLTQNDILIAQLEELRIIRRCVVGTVVLVVVIPIILATIISP